MKLFSMNFKSLVLIFMAVFILGMGLSGCDSGGAPGLGVNENDSGGSSNMSSEENGDITISMTDAAGDFSSYTVDVLSVNLTHANGAQVSTLPLATRIDFAQYTEMTEFLTATTVPPGVYVSVSLTLSYQDADIWVEDESGNIIQVDNIVDENGDPVTTIEASVRLEDKNQLTIAPGIPTHLILDFDLQASNQVSFDNPNAPTLTVDPFLAADVNRTNVSKIHRLRGLLNDVDLGSNSFSVILRPFYSPLADHHRRYGIRSVMTNEDTLYDINGVQYQGRKGLTSLDDLDRLTPVVAQGDLKFNPLRFEAREVYAGSSVPGGLLDVVKGNVIKRTGNRLTVKGASLIRSGSSVTFNDEVTIWIANTTKVKQQLSKASFTIDDISVGQQVIVFGALTNASPSLLQMDATKGGVHMLLTTIRGTVTSINDTDPSTQLTLDLQSIDRRRVGLFDFTGTGITRKNDADPDSYDVFTGTLDISTLSAGSPMQIKGFPEPFGQAPPDFSAHTLINVSDLKAYVKIDWYPATETPFKSISGTSLTLNLDGAGKQHHLIQGGVVTDLTGLVNAPSLAPDEDGEGLYILKYRGGMEIHTIFEDFADSIAELLEKEYTVKKLNATGQFDDSTSTLTTEFVEIWFH